jgi:hypothetical protein
MTIRWKKSEDGYVTSHCGRWTISPLYWGCVNAQMYELSLDGVPVDRFCATQKEAKASALSRNRER